MRVPIITVLDAGTEETKPFPAMDRAGNIFFSDKDGEKTTFSADIVESMDFPAGGARPETVFWMDGAPAWDIIITEQRIAVLNKYSKGLIGKPKAKQGKTTAGHLYFKSISNLSTFFHNGTPVLLILCFRADGTRTAIVIKSLDINSMKKMAVSLHDNIDKWLIKNKIKLDESDSNEKHQAVLKEWNEFNNNAWIDEQEHNVHVACKSFEKVPDRRVLS